jgi:hypothetical protein
MFTYHWSSGVFSLQYAALCGGGGCHLLCLVVHSFLAAMMKFQPMASLRKF